MVRKPGPPQEKKPDDVRAARLKAARKANIAKRKEQSRARATSKKKEG